MEDKIQDMQIELATFTATVKSWMETTNSYRKSLCQKIDDITQKVNDLPCKERKGVTSGMQAQLLVMWFILGGVALAVFSEWVKNK